MKKNNFNVGKQIENSENNENLMETNEIPTISIPDEEFNDFITCKVNLILSIKINLVNKKLSIIIWI